MSFYTGKIRNVPESGKCKCYQLAEYERLWEEQLEKKFCNMCGESEEKYDHGHIYVGQKERVFISPLCQGCNRSKRTDWVEAKAPGNWYELECECWEKKEYAGGESRKSRTTANSSSYGGEELCCTIL